MFCFSLAWLQPLLFGYTPPQPLHPLYRPPFFFPFGLNEVMGRQGTGQEGRRRPRADGLSLRPPVLYPPRREFLSTGCVERMYMSICRC